LEAVSESCVGTLLTTTCKLHSGTVAYPLIIQGINVTSNLDNYYPVQIDDAYASPGDLSTAPFGSPAGPLGALQWFNDEYYLSNATLAYNETSGTYLAIPLGPQAQIYYNTNSSDYIPNLGCGFLWDDPTQDILNAFSEVLFRASFVAAYYSDGSETQVFPATQTMDTLTYQSTHMFAIIGSVVLLLAVVAVSITLSGWWELGRDVSLSPLETAKAFGAQILHHPESPVNAHTLVARVGKRKVKYGEVQAAEEDGPEKASLRIQELGVGKDPTPIRKRGEDDD